MCRIYFPFSSARQPSPRDKRKTAFESPLLYPVYVTTVKVDTSFSLFFSFSTSPSLLCSSLLLLPHLFLPFLAPSVLLAIFTLAKINGAELVMTDAPLHFKFNTWRPALRARGCKVDLPEPSALRQMINGGEKVWRKGKASAKTGRKSTGNSPLILFLLSSSSSCVSSSSPSPILFLVSWHIVWHCFNVRLASVHFASNCCQCRMSLFFHFNITRINFDHCDYWHLLLSFSVLFLIKS